MNDKLFKFTVFIFRQNNYEKALKNCTCGL